MKRFRKITIDNIEYKWLFRYDDYDYINYPYLLIVMCSSQKSTLKIQFAIRDHFLLNRGLPAVFKGKEVSINLNQPTFIAQIIKQCVKDGVQFNQEGYAILDGIMILKELGYEINPILSD